MYQPEFFRIEELLPQRFFELNQTRGRQLWFLFDDRVLITLDRLRQHYDRRMIINTWLWDEVNPFNYRGFRPSDCEIGVKFSQHRFGRAIDADIDGMQAHEVREDIKKNKSDPVFEFITAVEEGINWVHFDVRNWDKEKYGICFFNPR